MISIAVCDDSKHIVELLAAKICNILKKKNVQYLVDEYTSGIELLNHIGKYECVFLDIDMPEIGGYEVAERIRSLKRDCCIIMATAQVSNFKPAFALNVFRFITKPFADNEIKEALERFLTKKAMNRTIESY
ncbi:MAG: response regulator, partial [Lachnospiraceae bacterium]|nr:response regulator [Lachnospiraceae bacterium]